MLSSMEGLTITQFIDAWLTSNRANLLLLESIPQEAFEASSRSRSRTVAEQFAHLHNARLMWIETAKPALMGSMKKYAKGGAPDREDLRTALEESADAIAELLRDGFEKGKVRGFKPDAAGFFTYLIAHEGHHRGQILLTLKLAGHKIPQEVQYGIWEWGKL